MAIAANGGSVRAQTLADGSVAVFNPATQQAIVISPAAAASSKGVPPGNAWGHALSLVNSGQAQLMSSSQLTTLNASTSSLVLLNGGGWPP
jgi:hypothetical protein